MKSKMTTREKTFWAITIPVVLLFFTFNTLPMLKGFMYSFTNYRGYGGYDYVGFRNYKDLFTDLRVGKSYLFTFKYALVGTVLVNVLSLIMALGLNSQIRFKSALRGIYFVPNILGGLVIGYIFSFFFTYIVPAVGNALNISWIQNSILASEKYAWIGVLIVGVWQAVATNTIIYISGLQTVPEGFSFPVSDTQAYKMLGNGWTVDVIAHILSYCPGITTEPLEVLSMYDGMSCGHLALDKLGATVLRYYATEIDKYAIKTTQTNFPDTIQLGDAFQVREDDWWSFFMD